MLHITNGDSAVEVLSQAVRGEFLPWRDVLHEGPVRAGLELEALSEERATFIAGAGWAPYEEVRKSFQNRDLAFGKASHHEEVVLWFEHDLYDQLQLVQVLDGIDAPRVSLVCEAEYLGRMTPARAAELFTLRNPVTRQHVREARAAWATFRCSDPMAIEPAAPRALQFLGAALRRHLEEFPWTTDGLSRLQREIMAGDTREEPMFLGDTVLEWHEKRLRDGLWLPRWLGGVQVSEDSPWRWDPAAGKLVELP